MLETLIAILKWHLTSPEIMVDEDGDIVLDWHGDWTASVSIDQYGGINWAILEPSAHGNSFDELQHRLAELSKQ